MARKTRFNHSLPRDVRFSLGLASIGLGAIGLYGVWVGGEISRDHEPVPVFVGMVVLAAIQGLRELGKWVLDINAGETSETSPFKIEDSEQPDLGSK